MSSYCCAFCASILANHVEIGEEFVPCYSDSRDALPLHGGCRKILEASLGGDLEEHTLFRAMQKLCCRRKWGDSSMDTESEWKSVPGKCVISGQSSIFDIFSRMRRSDEIVDIVRQQLPVDRLRKTPFTVELGQKVRNDPLAKLPYDIVLLVAGQLPIEDITSLQRASWHINVILNNDGFWKQIIRRDILPWLWELDPLPEGILTAGLDFRRVYGWLNVLSDGGGAGGAFMGIANRKKIWRVCGKVGEEYWKELRSLKVNS